MIAFILLPVLWLQVIAIGDSTEQNDGGWVTDEESRIAKPGPCNIMVRDATMTQREFLSEFAYKQPVVLRGVTDNSHIQRLSSKEALLQNYGSKTVKVSTANTYSYKKVDITLQNYIENHVNAQKLEDLGNETIYWFGDHNYTEWDGLFNTYKEPPYKLPGLTSVYSYGLAGAGTGVPFHFHGPGYAEVIYGRKRWFMYPPHQEPAFHPNKTTLHWLVEKYPDLPDCQLPLECTVGPGEAIYFPDHWWHGTLNIDTSVFISTFLG